MNKKSGNNSPAGVKLSSSGSVRNLMFHPQDTLPLNANTRSSPILSQLVMDSPFSAYQNKLLP